MTYTNSALEYFILVLSSLQTIIIITITVVILVGGVVAVGIVLKTIYS